MEVINATGRRKTAVARVYLSKGKGNIIVNKKDYKEFFPTTVLQGKVQQAFVATDLKDNYDVKVNVFGGGITGQAEAVRHAIARALVKVSEENRSLLKKKVYLLEILEWLNVKNQDSLKLVSNSSSVNVRIKLINKFGFPEQVINYCLVSKLLRLRKKLSSYSRVEVLKNVNN